MAIIPENLETQIGEKRQFYAIVKYSEGISLKMTGSIKWSTSDNSILAISESGICTALKEGYAEVYARYFKISAKACVRVNDYQ